MAVSSARKVLKFGGASLADGGAIRRAARRIAEQGGERPVVVVSAVGGVTGALERRARLAGSGRAGSDEIRVRHRSLLAELGLDPELLDRHLGELSLVLRGVRGRQRLEPAELDHVLSFGERMSARLLAAHLRAVGVAATPVDSWDLGLRSDANHGRARPLPGSDAAMRRALARVQGIPVVTGFVAATEAGRLTTLGRNGSDVSAALVAEALGASEVQFWKPVGGVLTADPKLVPDAWPLPHLDYATAREFARLGASVLHADALAPLERAGIPARVRAVAAPGEAGTLIDGRPRAPGPVGVACRELEHGLFAVVLVGSAEAPRVVAREQVAAAARELHSRLTTDALQRERTLR